MSIRHFEDKETSHHFSHPLRGQCTLTGKKTIILCKVHNENSWMRTIILCNSKEAHRAWDSLVGLFHPTETMWINESKVFNKTCLYFYPSLPYFLPASRHCASEGPITARRKSFGAILEGGDRINPLGWHSIWQYTNWFRSRHRLLHVCKF